MFIDVYVVSLYNVFIVLMRNMDARFGLFSLILFIPIGRRYDF